MAVFKVWEGIKARVYGGDTRQSLQCGVGMRHLFDGA